MTTLQEDALTETFRDVERMIDKLCWRFTKRYGGEFDDWKSVGCIAFMQAYENWQPKLSLFSTWVFNKVRFALMKHETKERERNSRTTYSSWLVDQVLGEEVEEEEVEETEAILV